MDPVAGPGGRRGGASRITLADTIRDAWADGLTEAGYEGWVAFVDEVPIFEEVRRPIGAHPLAAGAAGVVFREGAANCMEWRDLPHEKVHRFELYLRTADGKGRCVYRADRAEGSTSLRFLQMKLGGVTAPGGAGAKSGGASPERLGTLAYRVGHWDPAVPECVLYEFFRSGWREFGRCRDPWAPRPVGFGLNRKAFGL